MISLQREGSDSKTEEAARRGRRTNRIWHTCSKRGFSKACWRLEGRPFIEGSLNSSKQGGLRRSCSIEGLFGCLAMLSLEEAEKVWFSSTKSRMEERISSL